MVRASWIVFIPSANSSTPGVPKSAVTDPTAITK